MIGIVDYGMGNLGSIQNMLSKIGEPAVITADPAVLRKSDKLILPGVGAFDKAVQNLQRDGLDDLLNELVIHDQKPILGICLGMQLLSERSEEGSLRGFGWIPAETIRFQPSPQNPLLRVPHMGWNALEIRRPSPLFHELGDEPRFYFVHSYHVHCRESDHVLGVTHYGIEFHSIIGRENIFGTQFHPEKSHRFGLRLLRNFVEFRP